jgi:hypothetical protein
MDLAQSTQVVPKQMVTPDFGGILESYAAGQNIAKNRVALEQAQQGLETNKAVSAAIKKHTDKDGNLDINSAIYDISQDPNAVVDLPGLHTKLLALRGQQFTTDTAKLTNLSTKNSIAGQRIGPLVASIDEGKEVNRDQVINLFADLVRKGVFSPQEAGTHMATLPPKTGNAEQDRDALHNWIKFEQRATLNNETLFSKLLPQQQYVGTGGGTQILNVNQITGKVKPEAFIQGQLPTGTQLVAQEGDGTGLPTGTKYIMNPNGAPTIIPQGGPQGGMPQNGMNPMQQSQTPQKPPITALAPITENTNARGMEIVTQAREKATGIPTLRFNAGKIIEYAEKASTGTGGALLNDLKGNFAGLPFTGNTVTDFNLLGHNLAMQNAVLAKTPGINSSDAGQKLAGEISGTTSWDKKSIIEATRTNRMMGEINDLFNQGVQKYAKSPEKAIDFQNKWNSVLDLDTIRLYDAAINKKTDPKAFASVVDNLGGKESKRFVEAAKHIDKINELITKGQ